MAMAKKKAKTNKPIESYSHGDKQRVNNPPVGLVTLATDPLGPPKKTYAYDPHLDPQLVWAGKAERSSFEVPVVSLHVHERIDPKTIIQAVLTKHGKGGTSGSAPVQRSLFDEPEENPPLRDALDFYQHPHGWSNRLIAGDSLLVMNSLLEKEGMAGKVQMVYIDPPYGIRYGSNFQPFINRRDVKDGRDEDLTQEPEMVRAFRDTWELGIHSYLAYLRDRLLLARELLHESGSVFVQISDENLHHVREILDEVFHRRNLVSVISFATTSGFQTSALPRAGDYLIWYAKELASLKFRRLYQAQVRLPGDHGYRYLMMPNGRPRSLSAAELRGEQPIPENARLYTADNIVSQGSASEPQTYSYLGKSYIPRANCHWKPHYPDGLDRLAKAGRLHVSSDSLRYIRFADDFAWRQINNLWTDTLTGQFTDPKVYVVQTNKKVVSRCLLMTTDPGDLVLDPTCGSGTTTYVAEQWGRRWITCDTSRVAVTLAKQRLITALFDYYTLAHPDEGVGSGFICEKVPHITLESIANNPDIREEMARNQIDAAIARHAEPEVLYDRPEIDKSKMRVTGPFTVEAVPAPVVQSIDDIQPVAGQGTAVARSGVTVRQEEWRSELAKTGVRGKSGQRITFARLEPLAGTRYLQAVGETADETPRRVAVSFGPEHTPLEQRQVELAWEEARTLNPKPEILLFAAFHFDPEAAKDIDQLTPAKTGMAFLRLQMNTDLLTDDLKKKRSSNESFWLIGQPDVTLRKIHRGHDAGQWEVEIHGYDYYNPVSGKIESGDTSKIAMWLLDTDYDGRSLYPRQVFFPMAGPKDGWNRLARSLKAEIDEELIEAYQGTVSLPFDLGENRRVAAKIVDDRGIESLKVITVE
jgi:adenine-specific DNA-methyltransferase